jgi:signal transduction histidine kinase
MIGLLMLIVGCADECGMGKSSRFGQAPPVRGVCIPLSFIRMGDAVGRIAGYNGSMKKQCSHVPTRSTFFTGRNVTVLRGAAILALPAVFNILTLLVLSYFYDPSYFVFVDTNGHGSADTLTLQQPSGWRPVLSMVIVLFTAVAFLRIGQPNISAVLLLLFWTVAVTIVTVRAGVNTYIPAMLILPIGVSTLLFNRRVSFILALISAGVVWISVYLLLSRPDPIMFDFVRKLVITDVRQVSVYTYMSGIFWTVLYVAVAAITSLLAGDLQRSLQQSAATAQALKDLSEQLEQRVAFQTATLLTGEREKAMLAERTRLAREIHDTLAQGLAGIIVQLEAAQQAARSHHPAADQHIDLATRMARESLAEARRSVWNLRSGALERGDLRHALMHLVERFSHPHIKASWVCVGEWVELPADIESALLRVAQESLANVARHSQATQVRVTLQCSATLVVLIIHDDGVGFGSVLVHAHVPTSASFGIMGMRERIASLAGELTLHDESGAMVRVAVPLPTSVGDA